MAALPPDKVREIARKGGETVQRLRLGHRWSKEEARAMRRAQLDKKREEEEFMLRLRAKLRAQLGPSPGPSPIPEGEG